MTTSDIIAASAALIALCSFYVAKKQAELAREHNRLSVRPFLGIYRKEFGNHPIEYSVENRGIGPAVIKRFHVLIDGKEVIAPHGNYIHAAMDMLGLDRNEVSGHLLGVNEVLKAGQEVVLVQFPNSDTNKSLHKELLGKLPRMKFKILYESIYEEKYEYEGNG
ncbi:hypothetical protein ACUHMQ_12855 [Chitinimonas sp. PSY-7]|uniref:hypothetical protein n=1 Tax=Chitinimonas sp. PSY-7 TaxID=3459088 RepID=UPI00404002A6